MLSVAVLTDNSVTADGIEHTAAETGILSVVYKGSVSGNVNAIIRQLGTKEPDFILIDLNEWIEVEPLARGFQDSNLKAIIIGFRARWDRMEELVYKGAGIHHLIREPFSPAEFESVVYESLHKERPLTNRNILSFLPAKAGCGASSVAIHTARGLAENSTNRVLLIESDRRSGIFSIMLGLDHRLGLDDALSLGGALTSLEWHQHIVRCSGFHLLLANPEHRKRLPAWADYYQLLAHVQNQYEYILVDLPEVVNEATAEVVRASRSIFIVCTPEIVPMKMAKFRAAELEACDIPADRIQLVVNRAGEEHTAAELERLLDRPVFASLPNDYAELKEATLQSRLASPSSAFTRSCINLARKLSGLPEAEPERSKLALLRKLARIAG
jgi:Mrp family chromosome partitioning ATPase